MRIAGTAYGEAIASRAWRWLTGHLPCWRELQLSVAVVSLLRSRCTSQPFETLEPARHSVPTGAVLVRLYVPSVTAATMVQLVKPDAARSNFLFRRGGRTSMPTIDGLPLVKPPYGRVTAIDLHRGEIAWMSPVGDGPRSHPLIRHLDLPPLGLEARGNPLVTGTLLFVAQGAGNIGAAQTGDVEPRKLHAFDKTTGAPLWSAAPPVSGPLASPMTYLHGGRQYVVVAVGGGSRAELVAWALAE
jgi:quinoprotein glucose dehydrogenase